MISLTAWKPGPPNGAGGQEIRPRDAFGPEG
jgi:hypothetical protein